MFKVNNKNNRTKSSSSAFTKYFVEEGFHNWDDGVVIFF